MNVCVNLDIVSDVTAAFCGGLKYVMEIYTSGRWKRERARGRIKLLACLRKEKRSQNSICIHWMWHVASYQYVDLLPTEYLDRCLPLHNAFGDLQKNNG